MAENACDRSSVDFSSFKVTPNPFEFSDTKVKARGMGSDSGAIDGTRRGSANNFKGNTMIAWIKLDQCF
jgi:hypothetical protein